MSWSTIAENGFLKLIREIWPQPPLGKFDHEIYLQAVENLSPEQAIDLTKKIRLENEKDFRPPPGIFFAAAKERQPAKATPAFATAQPCARCLSNRGLEISLWLLAHRLASHAPNRDGFRNFSPSDKCQLSSEFLIVKPELVEHWATPPEESVRRNLWPGHFWFWCSGCRPSCLPQFDEFRESYAGWFGFAGPGFLRQREIYECMQGGEVADQALSFGEFRATLAPESGDLSETLDWLENVLAKSFDRKVSRAISEVNKETKKNQAEAPAGANAVDFHP